MGGACLKWHRRLVRHYVRFVDASESASSSSRRSSLSIVCRGRPTPGRTQAGDRFKNPRSAGQPHRALRAPRRGLAGVEFQRVVIYRWRDCPPASVSGAGRVFEAKVAKVFADSGGNPEPMAVRGCTPSCAISDGCRRRGQWPPASPAGAWWPAPARAVGDVHPPGSGPTRSST